MKNKPHSDLFAEGLTHYEELFGLVGAKFPEITVLNKRDSLIQESTSDLAEILFVTSYPPRECGIATYSQDLIKALNNKFSSSFSIKVCALESDEKNFQYPAEVEYRLKTSIAAEYEKLAIEINKNDRIKIVLIQHEFGLYSLQEQAFLQFLYKLSKPVAIVFHTVLPHPDEKLKSKVNNITSICEHIIVMTHTSVDILTNDYGLSKQKISVIAHGTHLVHHLPEEKVSGKYPWYL